MFRWPWNELPAVALDKALGCCLKSSIDAYELALAPNKAVHGPKLDVRSWLNEFLLVADRWVREMVAAPFESLFPVACLLCLI